MGHFMASKDFVVTSALSSLSSTYEIAKHSNKSKCVTIALAAVALVGLVFFCLGACQALSHTATVCWVQAICGALLTVGSIGVELAFEINECLRPPKKIESPSLPRALTLPQPTKSVNPEPVVYNDTLETTFWEMHYQRRELHTLLEMAVNSHNDPPTCAEFLVHHFSTFMKHEYPAFSFSEDEKNVLIGKVSKQLLFRFKALGMCNETLHLTNNVKLTVFSTVGDGSCGLHALLGVEKNGVFKTDAVQKREQFCKWLEKKFQNHKLPSSIVTVLQDYFLYFDLAPTGFKKYAEPLFHRYYNGYTSLSKEEQDNRKRDFVNDKEVFAIYLENLKKTSVYLLQDELAAAAKCFKIQVILYQPGWFNEHQKITFDTLNDEGIEVVHIWYNGVNHYERAFASAI